MPPEQVKPGRSHGDMPTRRDFLRAAAAATLAGLPAGMAFPPPVPASRPTSGPTAASPWWLGPATARSRVVEVLSTTVLPRADAVDEIVLSEMFGLGLRVLTGAGTTQNAWRRILGTAKRITLKFNSVGAGVLGTNGAMARVLVESLVEAGYRRQDLALVEIPGSVARDLGTRAPEEGWGTEIPVGSGSEELANYLLAADAVINVPLLKTHQIAGMSGALKNLSHALIRHPARYHANGCSPYVGQVVVRQEVSAKVRLNIVNALRVVARHGPDAAEGDIVTHRGLLFGFDPVAVDAVGHERLIAHRRTYDLGGAFAVPYLSAAAACGAGRREPHQVELLPVAVPAG